MRNINIFLLLALFSLGSEAYDKMDDNLAPVYQAITEKALPGISGFINALIEEESDDFSDNWFVIRAQCAYFSWANAVNRAITNNQDLPDNGQLIHDTFDSVYCFNLPQNSQIQIPDLSSSQPFSHNTPHYPTESGTYMPFSSTASYVQNMPSYEELDPEDFESADLMRSRIVLETILFMLGTKTQEPTTVWRQFHSKHFRAAMRPFHCSRFIEEDYNQYQNCLTMQSSDDIKRSNHAIKLTNIALGDYQPSMQPDIHSFDSYGYQSGFAIAANNANFMQISRYHTGYSVVAETFIFLALLRNTLLH
ncbi:hypothetical protein [Endozoicomonas numazuensis]|uniref:Uncharacterized protein n=1 Tax=Endozoicomonas numazuensis TaxID=1137799 RepID=A0A081NMS6_9GAMM|nr:hypothetical protein [Endozoicomonas numazuensis]KEQ19749.1 hypothetical protein GZ78_07735 [Endozoicomonas numazuensis]